MSYFSPTSVFSLSTFLPSYLVAAPVPQPESRQTPDETTEPRPEPDEDEESAASLRTEEVALISADTQAEDKPSAELDEQHSEVFLIYLYLQR